MRSPPSSSQRALRSIQVAVAIGVVGAIFSAIAYVVIRRLGSTEHHMVVVFYFPLVTGPASLPILAVEGLVLPQGFEWLLLLGIGVAAQLGQIEITKGFKLETAGRASSVTYLQIVLAYTWGVLLFGEYPNAISILGALPRRARRLQRDPARSLLKQRIEQAGLDAERLQVLRALDVADEGHHAAPAFVLRRDLRARAELGPPVPGGFDAADRDDLDPHAPAAGIPSGPGSTDTRRPGSRRPTCS